MNKIKPSLADFGLYKEKELKATLGVVKYVVGVCILLIIIVVS